MSATQIALRFIDAINRGDVPAILDLMTEDHIFMDTYGNTEDKEAMRTGWPGYFAWFPDYRIEVEELFEKGDTVAVFGHASGTYSGKAENNRYHLPAAWKVVVMGDKIKLWQVICDSKIPYELMGG